MLLEICVQADSDTEISTPQWLLQSFGELNCLQTQRQDSATVAGRCVFECNTAWCLFQACEVSSTLHCNAMRTITWITCWSLTSEQQAAIINCPLLKVLSIYVDYLGWLGGLIGVSWNACDDPLQSYNNTRRVLLNCLLMMLKICYVQMIVQL